MTPFPDAFSSTDASGTLRSGSGSFPPPNDASDWPRRSLAKGEALYRTGDPADAVFRVDEGLLKIALEVPGGRERIVAVAGPGDLLGAVVPDPVLSEGAEALSPCVRVRVVPRDEAERAFGPALANAAGDRLRDLRSVVEDGELPVSARLARTLLRLGRRFGQSADDGSVRITLPLTHENFASMVGAARETTTALLGEMRRDGLLAGTRGRYVFEREAMRDFAAEAVYS